RTTPRTGRDGRGVSRDASWHEADRRGPTTNAQPLEAETFLPTTSEESATLIKSPATHDGNLTAVASVMGTPFLCRRNNVVANSSTRAPTSTASASLLIVCSRVK